MVCCSLINHSLQFGCDNQQDLYVELYYSLERYSHFCLLLSTHSVSERRPLIVQVYIRKGNGEGRGLFGEESTRQVDREFVSGSDTCKGENVKQLGNELNEGGEGERGYAECWNVLRNGWFQSGECFLITAWVSVLRGILITAWVSVLIRLFNKIIFGSLQCCSLLHCHCCGLWSVFVVIITFLQGRWSTDLVFYQFLWYHSRFSLS